MRTKKGILRDNIYANVFGHNIEKETWLKTIFETNQSTYYKRATKRLEKSVCLHREEGTP